MISMNSRMHLFKRIPWLTFPGLGIGCQRTCADALALEIQRRQSLEALVTTLLERIAAMETRQRQHDLYHNLMGRS